MRIRHPLRLAALLLVFALLSAAAAWTTYKVSQGMGLAELQTTGRHRLDLYSASLEREIGKYAYFPATLGLERNVLNLLQKKGGPELPARINSYLEQLNERAGTLAIYVIDDTGRVLVSSNWRRADSYVGEDLSFRPYFRDAMASGSGRFFGIGMCGCQSGDEQ